MNPPQQETDIKKNNDTLTSSPLRWLSVLTYVVLTLSIFNRDPERSGGNSVVGAIPKNELLYYMMSSLILLQCSAYTIVCIGKIKNTLINIPQDIDTAPTTDHSTFMTILSSRPKLSILYWGLGTLSCTLSILNSIYLLSYKTDDDSEQSIVINDNHTNPSPSSTENTNSSFIKSAPSTIAGIDTLNHLNKAAVSGSIWAWNLCNLIEMGVYIALRPNDDTENFIMSTMFFLSNIFRTLVVSKVAEDITYPGYIIFKWSSLPFKSSYVKLKRYLHCTTNQNEQEQNEAATDRSLSISR